MVEEIREYVKKCPQCQRMNANFIKSSTKPHPIPVQPKVWCQVSRCIECSSKCVCNVCISILLTIVFLIAGWYRFDWASANYIEWQEIRGDAS